MKSETFVAHVGLLPDYALARNWSGGVVPGAGTSAVVNDGTVLIDPGTTLSAAFKLEGEAALAGNGGGFSLGPGSAVMVGGRDALFADGAIVNHGHIVLSDGTQLTVVVEAGAAIAQSYGLRIPSLQNTGEVRIFGGATLAVAGTELSNTGAIVVDGGVLAVSGGGVDGGQTARFSGGEPGGEIVLEDGGTARFSDGIADQHFGFDGAGTLVLGDVVDISGVSLRDFSTLDSIFVPSVADGKTLLRETVFVDLPADTAPEVVAAGTGAEILLEHVPPCFARGSGVLTPSGYRAVETLRPGDPVVTMGGDVRALRWVGSRTLDIAAHRRPEAVQPVRICGGALSPGVPARPLRLSPDHALLLRGELVPVKLLVNGITILRERACMAVTYFHLELDRHDILLAENLAVESYIDTGNRALFDNTLGTPRRDPVFGRGTQWDASAYAPLCLGGPVLREIRRELRARTAALGYISRTLTDVTLWAAEDRLKRVGGADHEPVFRLNGRLEAKGGRIAIRSARFVPAEFGAGEDDAADERLLGIALRAIRLNAATFPARRVAVAGFYPRAGNDTADWTDGNAEIEVPAGVATIALDIVALPLGWIMAHRQA